MQAFICQTPSKEQPSFFRSRFAPRFGQRALVAASIAVAVVWAGLLPGPSKDARGADPGQSASPAIEPDRAGFTREMRRILKVEDDRLVALARQILAFSDSPQGLGDRTIQAQIEARSAESQYLNAKLAREIAEIAVKEYKDGIFVQDFQAAEGELLLARSDLERGKDLIEVAKERQARIKEVADERTAFGRMVNDDYGDRVVKATLELQRRKYALEQAEFKKKILLEYTKEKRIKELESEVKKAHSDELARQATWELMKAKLEKLQRAAKAPWPASDIGSRLLALYDRAIPIEEKARALLEDFANSAKSDGGLAKEIRELTNQLGALIEEAEAAKAADDLARLKSLIREATRRR